MARALLSYLVVGSVLCCGVARAEDIRRATYDRQHDQIVLDIAYRGTQGEHRFDVAWGRCTAGTPPRIAGRLIDRQGSERALEDFRAHVRVPLDALPCRPVRATLRLGRVSHATILIPPQPTQASSKAATRR